MRPRSDAPERVGVLPKPDDPLAEIKARLAQFLLALIQAFLRTGYYTPNHPQARTAKVGLYEDFQKLFTAKEPWTRRKTKHKPSHQDHRSSDCIRTRFGIDFLGVLSRCVC